MTDFNDMLKKQNKCNKNEEAQDEIKNIQVEEFQVEI